MKTAFTLSALLALPLSAQLLITEVMPDSLHSDGGANGDWIEIVNTGNAAVNLSGFRFNDETAIPAPGEQVFPSFLLQPGATAIALNEDNADRFRQLWGLPASVRIFSRTETNGFPGLSANGEEAVLFSPSNTVASSFAFPAATAGRSFARLNNGDSIPGGISIEGTFGAFRSQDLTADVGSPGFVAEPAAPLAPDFISPFQTVWVDGTDIANSTFTVQAVDPNPTDTVTLTSGPLPAWLTFTDNGDGTGSFSGIPPATATGDLIITLSASDSSGLTGTTTQDYLISIAPSLSPIILNEYNAVSNNNFLDGEDSLETDANLGRIEGNGGDWIEFVLIGLPGQTTVDLRGWLIEISSTDSSRSLQLSNHIALSQIPVGTILTFTETQSTSDTGLPILSRANTAGYSWSNIWMFDSILIDQENSLHPDNRSISDLDTTVTITSSTGDVVYGPGGESIFAQDDDDNGFPDDPISVSDEELLRLEGDPLSTVSPISIDYDDGSGSTFGLPNIWSDGTLTQSFAPYRTSEVPATFASVPSRVALGGEYNVTIPVSLNGGAIPALLPLVLPDFIDATFTGSELTLQNNRPLTSADAGAFEVTLLLSNGTSPNSDSYLVYELTVVDPTPSIILNEYNAVSPENFLNGGDSAVDSDGATGTQDSFFGRVQGNGGNWFELVVVGDGTPGSTSLLDWTIEIGRGNNGGVFESELVVSLDDPLSFATVANGTILTFIDTLTADGGLDSELNRLDELSTSGFAWSNINLNDTDLVTVSDLSALEIDSNNTQFVIRNAAGRIVFGPAGEGVSPLSGVGSTEILELENDPSPAVTPFEEATATTMGYDDGSSGSTFGAPNISTTPDLVSDRVQDFSAFQIPAGFPGYLTTEGLVGTVAQDDSDLDGFTNLEEYLFGSSASSSQSFPFTAFDPETQSVTYTLRINDPAFTLAPEQSTDLINWVTSDLSLSSLASPLGPNFTTLTATYTGTEPKVFFRASTQNP